MQEHYLHMGIRSITPPLGAALANLLFCSLSAAIREPFADCLGCKRSGGACHRHGTNGWPRGKQASTRNSSQIRTKLRDWAVRQAKAGCYSRAAMSSKDSKTLHDQLCFILSEWTKSQNTGLWLFFTLDKHSTPLIISYNHPHLWLQSCGKKMTDLDITRERWGGVGAMKIPIAPIHLLILGLTIAVINLH